MHSVQISTTIDFNGHGGGVKMPLTLTPLVDIREAEPGKYSSQDRYYFGQFNNRVFFR